MKRIILFTILLLFLCSCSAGNNAVDDSVINNSDDVTEDTNEEDIIKLTDETAVGVLSAAWEKIKIMGTLGFSHDEFERLAEWCTDDNTDADGLVASPDFADMDDFDEHYLCYITNNTLDALKETLCVTENGGRLWQRPKYFYDPFNKLYFLSEAKVLSVRNYGEFARVTFSFPSVSFGRTYDENGGITKTLADVEEVEETYTFRHSEKYGWVCELPALVKGFDYGVSVISEIDYKFSQNLRSAGYDDITLDEKTALNITLYESDRLELMAEHSGLDYYNDSWLIEKWVLFPANIASFAYVANYNGIEVPWESTPRTYYVKELDTVEEFDAYFLRVFTPRYLEKIKEKVNFTIENGKCAATNNIFYSIGNVENKELARVVDISYSDNGKTAYVTISHFAFDEEFICDSTYTLCFDKEYGWRVDEITD